MHRCVFGNDILRIFATRAEQSTSLTKDLQEEPKKSCSALVWLDRMNSYERNKAFAPFEVIIQNTASAPCC